jgi:hypothetical protein
VGLATWNSASISSKSSSTSSLLFFFCFGILHTVGNEVVGWERLRRARMGSERLSYGRGGIALES